MPLPRILGKPIELLCYPPEMIIAEKVVTLILLGSANSRWKDFVDISTLSRQDIDIPALSEAIARVAAFRQVQLTTATESFTGFTEADEVRWAAWLRKMGNDADVHARLSDQLRELARFLDPLLASIGKD